jgi:hypothetical protein
MTDIPFKILPDLIIYNKFIKIDENGDIKFFISGSSIQGLVSSSYPIVAPSFTGSLHGTSSYATTASYVENASNITTPYNLLREIAIGNFDIDGTKTIKLNKFIASSDIDYVNISVFTKQNGSGKYTNDVISIHYSASIDNKISVELSAPVFSSSDSYKIIAIKEVGAF